MKLKNVFSVNSDSKTIKGLKRGFLTGILYLAPHKLSGLNVCSNAVTCIKSCLFNAGRGKFKTVYSARIKKTLLFINERKYFLNCIRYSIKALIRKAGRENLIPCIRLNGTSDLNFYKFGLMNEFKNIQFYDYTKHRLNNNQLNKLPKNYHLTFSFDNTEKNIEYCKSTPLNFAVVFNTKDKNQLPRTFLGYKVISGDNTDLRFLDNNKYCIGLTSKGSKKEILQGVKDTFIIETDKSNLLTNKKRKNTMKKNTIMTSEEIKSKFNLNLPSGNIDNFYTVSKVTLNKGKKRTVFNPFFVGVYAVEYKVTQTRI